MSYMDTFTMIDTAQLNFLNAHSRLHGRERTMSDALMRRVDADGLHVVSGNHILPDAVTVRCLILIKLNDKVQPTVGTLDIHIDDFQTLPRFAYESDGSIVSVVNPNWNRRTVKQARAMADQINESWAAAS